MASRALCRDLSLSAIAVFSFSHASSFLVSSSSTAPNFSHKVWWDSSANLLCFSLSLMTFSKCTVLSFSLDTSCFSNWSSFTVAPASSDTLASSFRCSPSNSAFSRCNKATFSSADVSLFLSSLWESCISFPFKLKSLSFSWTVWLSCSIRLFNSATLFSFSVRAVFAPSNSFFISAHFCCSSFIFFSSSVNLLSKWELCCFLAFSASARLVFNLVISCSFDSISFWLLSSLFCKVLDFFSRSLHCFSIAVIACSCELISSL